MSIRKVREIVVKNGRNRKTRSKTFKSIKDADEWAKQNLKTNYEVVVLREEGSKKNGKIRVVAV